MLALTQLRIPDLWQQQAAAALQAGRDVVLHAPTGCGKTLVFELHAPRVRGQAIYTVPTRALANDKLREWQAQGWDVGMTTGDVTHRPGAAVVVATLEAQRHRLLHDDGPGLLVVDEYQMLADAQRGRHYEMILAMAPPATRLLLMSGSVANPGDIAAWLRRNGRRVELVETHERPVPLEEIDVARLSGPVPAGVDHFWSRIAARAWAEGLGPILFFAPRRAAAEQLARRLADELPCDDPLTLTATQAKLAGDPLARLLRQRIAFHHSGLSYVVRAGLIEPLAKAGQLRAVAATMGLAAGVNFSMRSVVVTETRYQIGNRECEVTPDQLLQMFGRAGRRGLDERGYILLVPGRPRLDEARPAPIRRGGPLDWPAFLDVMLVASERGEPPFLAASRLHARLFRESTADLGLPAPDAVARPCGLWIPTERSAFTRRAAPEMQGSTGEWEPLPKVGPVGMGEAWVQKKGGWQPFLHDAARVPLPQGATLGRLREGRRWWYAPRWMVAQHQPEHGWRAVKPLRRLAAAVGPEMARAVRNAFTPEKLTALAEILLGPWPTGALATPHLREPRLTLMLDLRACSVPAHRDRRGRPLFEPSTRVQTPPCCESCPEQVECRARPTRPVPAHQWRLLGLIAPDGTPTARGRIFRLFHGGEGLALAAGLEADGYDPALLLFELAELRAGRRFALTEHAGESRLAALCRATYAHVDIPGYLEGGLPPDYGPGAGHVVRLLHHEPHRLHALAVDGLLRGDLERAQTEWRSLLRQIAAAPQDPSPRWGALQAEVRAFTAAWPTDTLPELPALTAEQRRTLRVDFPRANARRFPADFPLWKPGRLPS